MPSAQSKALSDLLDCLDQDKGKYLEKAETATRSFIQGQSREHCVTIVEVLSDSCRLEWSPLDDPKDWAKRFFKLVGDPKNPRYHDHPLDCWLSEPVAAVVSSIFQSFYTERQDVIGKGMVAMLREDQALTHELVREVVRSLRSSTSPLTDHAASLLVESVTQQISSHSGSEIVTHVTSTVATTASHQVGAVIGTTVLHVLAVSIAKIIAQHFGTVAFQHFVAGVAKKIVIKIVVTAFATSLAATLGVTGTTSIFWFVALPLIAAFLTYEIHEFPNKLGRKVGASVRSSLAGEFRDQNRSILLSVFNDTVQDNMKQLAEAIAENPDVVRSVENFVNL